MDSYFSEEKLRKKLEQLCNLPAETEVVEFKEAKNSFDSTKLGKYFSALSNEANLKGQPYAWLIFGVENSHHKIVGSSFRPERKNLDSLKPELAARITGQITFVEIYELNLPEGRVVMFQIPAAPKGIPLGFEGHYYGRNGEQLGALNIEEIQRIRDQALKVDWSAGVIPDATLNDLDSTAISQARINYKSKFPNITKEVDSWTDETFLNKAKILIKGNKNCNNTTGKGRI